MPRTNRKRQTPLLDDLPQKYSNCIAQPEAARFQYRRGFGLEIIINSSSNNTLFHGAHCSYIFDQSQQIPLCNMLIIRNILWTKEAEDAI